MITTSREHRPPNHSLECNIPDREAPDLLLATTSRSFDESKEEEIVPLTASSADIRVANGQCPSCGQQLFIVREKNSKKGLLGSNKTDTVVVRKPLTVEGHVSRGQCLDCRGDAPQKLVSSHTQSFGVNADSRSSAVSTATYQGDYDRRGQKHGQGVQTWSNGDVYVGTFSDDLRNGQGTLTFADGSEYVGNWSLNLMHGLGTRRFPNGDVYTGPYYDGKRQTTEDNREGRFYYANGDLYVGSWWDDQMHGSGRYYYTSGQRFEGTFRAGRRHGKGKLQRTDGTLEVFQYDNDIRTGVGVRWSEDRNKAWRLEYKNKRLIKKKISTGEAIQLGYQMEQSMLHNDELEESIIQ